MGTTTTDENEIKVYDISGRLIKEINQAEGQILLDTSLWKVGTYLVQIGDFPSQTFKVLKQ